VAGELNRPRQELRGAFARIDLLRLEENYRAVSAFAGLPLIPVVKADAYGHGAPEVARRLVAQGAPMLAVAFVEEALALRRAGIRSDILVLSFTPRQVGALLGGGLTPLLSTEASARAFAAAATPGLRLRAHVEVDTGMGRLGFPSRGLPERLKGLLGDGVEVEGLMTHLAAADEDEAQTEKQLDAFDQVLVDLARAGVVPRVVHAAHSAGLRYLRKTHTHARPGLLLYGLKPRPLSPEVAVRPVMSVHGEVLLLKEVAPGTPISYGGRFVATRPSLIATLPLGYADGVPRTRLMEQEGSLFRCGHRVRVAGTVCMDFLMVDVTDLPGVKEGDEITLFGDEPTAWDLASWSGTTVWDVLTSVGPRLARIYTEAGREVATGGPALL
jgi:alanine racemase